MNKKVFFQIAYFLSTLMMNSYLFGEELKIKGVEEENFNQIGFLEPNSFQSECANFGETYQNSYKGISSQDACLNTYPSNEAFPADVNPNSYLYDHITSSDFSHTHYYCPHCGNCCCAQYQNENYYYAGNSEVYNTIDYSYNYGDDCEIYHRNKHRGSRYDRFDSNAFLRRWYGGANNFSAGISSYQGTSTGPGPNGGYPGSPRGFYRTNYLGD